MRNTAVYSYTDSNAFQQGFRGAKSYEILCKWGGSGFSTSNFSPLLPHTARPSNCYKGINPLAGYDGNCEVTRA
jgi:hypothetical protein